jgi:hypothetical protein
MGNPLVLQMLDIMYATYSSSKMHKLLPLLFVGVQYHSPNKQHLFSPTSIDHLDFMRGTQPVCCEVENGFLKRVR